MWKGEMMNNLVWLAGSALVTFGIVFSVALIVMAISYTAEMIRERKRLEILRKNHEAVQELRRYHVGGFIREHK